MPAIQTPKSVPELVKLIASHGKRSVLISGVNASSDRITAGKVVIDLTGVHPLNEIDEKKHRITIGTGMNLGRFAREATGENGLLRQAASIIANPLVRNKITLVAALIRNPPTSISRRRWFCSTRGFGSKVPPGNGHFPSRIFWKPSQND